MSQVIFESSLYIASEIEEFTYAAEAGFAQSVAAENDWLLEYDGDMTTLRTGEELSEHTDEGGEFGTYSWD